MIYLIAKIFLYMLLTLCLGFAAGWLSRNIVGAKREEELQKSVTESRSRVPQFESLMRSRDEQVRKMREELSGKDKRIAELSADLQGKDAEIRRAQQEASKLASRNQALENLEQHQPGDAALGHDIGDSNGVIASADADTVAALEAELNSVKQQLADAIAEAASAEAQLASARSAAAGSGAVSSAELEELKSRVRQQASEQDRLTRALEIETRKVTELERERELQNKSLQVLHQQLELERERAAAMPPAAAGDSAAAAHH